MQKLINSGLFGEGLINIEEPQLINRYNECLKDIGIKETKLKQFHVDGWGWSPEIANEFNDKNYLSHGFANPYGIILTPSQIECPIYIPYYSFDWDLTQTIFQQYKIPIADITTESGLWFEVDQEISAYQSAQDLLMVDALMLRFFTPKRMIKAAREQRKLVRQFYDSPVAWADETLHDNLIESCKEHGDLRFRSLEIPDFPYTNVRSFYTRAFQGVFVLRVLPGQKPVLVFENTKSVVSGELEHDHIEFSIDDTVLFEYLLQHKIIKDDLNVYRSDLFSLTRLRDAILVDLITKHYPDNQEDLTNVRVRSKYVAILSEENKLTPEYYELDKLMAQLKRGSVPQSTELPFALRLSLCYPNYYLTEETKKVIWQLINKMSIYKDIAMQYIFDKETFFIDYQTWNPSKKNWSIGLIKDNRQLFNFKMNLI